MQKYLPSLNFTLNPQTLTDVGSYVSGISGMILACLYKYVLIAPLRFFYFQGYWLNKNPEDVCSEMTNIPSSHWTASPDAALACNELMERQFLSFVVTILIGGYGCVIAFLLFVLGCKLFVSWVIGPLFKDLIRETKSS